MHIALSEKLPRSSRGCRGGVRVSDYPPRKYLPPACKAGCETANYKLSKRQICQSGRCMAPRGEGGETQGKAGNCTLGILSMCGPTTWSGTFEQHLYLKIKHSFV